MDDNQHNQSMAIEDLANAYRQIHEKVNSAQVQVQNLHNELNSM